MHGTRFGLLGQGISYSRSPELFQKIWVGATDSHSFSLIDTDNPIDFIRTVRANPEWGGFTVTTPYKLEILPHLDLGCTDIAQEVGAINVVRRTDRGLMGHNSDVYGFTHALSPMIQDSGAIQALILGTGGAAKAVQVGLAHLGISFKTVSRSSSRADLHYEDISPSIIQDYRLIINATPLGSPKYPGQMPALPYEALTTEHLLFDLTYAPAVTPFLAEGLRYGATVRNGFAMLWYQAVEAWRFFTE